MVDEVSEKVNLPYVPEINAEIMWAGAKRTPGMLVHSMRDLVVLLVA